jgi:hypothetical protein
MPIPVVSFATYLTRDDQQWRPDDYNALKFIQAIKGEEINKWAWIRVQGVSRKLQQANADVAIDWFGDFAAEYLAGQKLRGPICLVPIPNSQCTATNGKAPRTTRLAESIAARLPNSKVCDCIRWKKVMLPARKGGSRDPQVHYDNMVVTCDLRKGKVILVDDVRTKGSHIRAAAAKVSATGGQCILAVCAGRTVLAQEANPFSILKEELPDFAPE